MKTLFALLVSAVVFSAAHANAETLPATKYPPLNETLFNSLFQKITPDKMKGNPFTLIRKDCFLITAGTSKSYNSMTAGWGGFGVLWGRDVATVYVRNNRFTYRFLEQDPYYTLSFYDSPERKELMTVFGRTSGRDTDKIKASGFTPVVVPGGGVAYTQARMIILCKRLVGVPLTSDMIPPDIAAKTYGNTGDFHKMYTGEILGIWIRK